MGDWAELARERGAICHVGRVNSARRIHLCASAGVTSFDGSGVSRYAVEIPQNPSCCGPAVASAGPGFGA